MQLSLVEFARNVIGWNDRRQAAERHTVFLKIIPIVVIHFIAVAVAFVYRLLTVEFICPASFDSKALSVRRLIFKNK